VAPLPNYLPPIYNLGDHRSANGIVEYPSNVGCVQMQGDLLISNYSVGDDITRIRLTPDGMSVDAAQSLVGGLNNPLPLLINPAGTIFVGEFGPDRVTALIPRSLGCWSQRAVAPVNLLDPGSAEVNGLLYVVAGKTGGSHQSALYSYNPANDTWTTLPASLPGAAVENPAAVGLNGKLYVFGGSTAPFTGAVPDARVYDPASGQWMALSPMNAARGGATARAIGNKIYVVGGLDVDGASLDTMEIYDPATDDWTDGPSMAVRRDNPGSAAVNGKLYVFGGRTREASGMEVNGTLNSLEEFDPLTNQWTTKANMPTGRRTMSVGTLNGRIQVIGGERTASGGTFEVNEEYDPATDTWRALQGRSPGRHGAAYATIGDTLYIAVGGITGGTSTSNLLEAFVF
jgi:N-acetylneuraminic acid mutarotase